MKESIRQAKFIVNDCMIVREQEAHFPAHLCAMNKNSFIIYIPPTLHMLEQVGVEIKNPENYVQKDALNLLIYSFSHLSLNPLHAESYQSSYNLVKSVPEERKSIQSLTSASRVMSVVGDSKNKIYKPVVVGGNDEERRRMVENNMKECVIV